MTSPLPAAASFLRRTARPLEARARECRFEGAPQGGFVAAPCAFRREDGASGGALEPDLRAEWRGRWTLDARVVLGSWGRL